MATEQEEEAQAVVDWYGGLFNGNGGSSATELLLDRSESETSDSSESDADEVPAQEPKGSADDASVHPVDDVPGDVELPGLELEDLDRFITGEEEATVVIPDTEAMERPSFLVRSSHCQQARSYVHSCGTAHWILSARGSARGERSEEWHSTDSFWKICASSSQACRCNSSKIRNGWCYCFD